MAQPIFPRGTALGALGTAVLAHPSRAQPGRPVTLVVPCAAGGGTDIVGREFAIGFAEALGQTVVVDNRGGRQGMSGRSAWPQARPDGTSLLFAVFTNIDMTIIRHL